MDRRVSLEKACEEGAVFISQTNIPIEKEYASIEKYLSYGLFHTNRGKGRGMSNRISAVVQYFAMSLSTYYFFYALYTICTRKINELTTVMLLVFMCNSVVIVSGAISLMSWLKRGKINKFFRLLHTVNESRGIVKYQSTLQKLNRRFNYTTNFIIALSTFFVVYFASGVQPTNIDNDAIFGVLYYEKLFVLFHTTQMYLFIGFSLQLHIYAFCLEAAVIEIRFFMEEAIEKKCTNESEAIAFFTQSIEKNSRLCLSVRYLDDIFKRFVFFEVGLVIPVLLFMTYISIKRRDSPFAEFGSSLILVVLCIIGFYILTVFPARVHSQIKNTRTLFCSYIRQWIPYGQRVHTAALVFSSHLEQNDMGVTLWGFALLSKPLILTSLSAMTTALAIFLQFSDCKRQIESGHGNSSLASPFLLHDTTVIPQ